MEGDAIAINFFALVNSLAFNCSRSLLIFVLGEDISFHQDELGESILRRVDSLGEGEGEGEGQEINEGVNCFNYMYGK